MNVQHDVISTYIQPLRNTFSVFSLRTRKLDTLPDQLSVKMSYAGDGDDYTHQFFPSKVVLASVIESLTYLIDKTTSLGEIEVRNINTKHYLQINKKQTVRGVNHFTLALTFNHGSIYPLCSVDADPELIGSRYDIERYAHDEIKKQVVKLRSWLIAALDAITTPNKNNLSPTVLEHTDSQCYISLLGEIGRRGSVVNYVHFDKVTKVLTVGSPRGKFTTKFSEHQTWLLKNTIADISTTPDKQIILDVESNFYIRRIDGIEGTTIKRLIINSDVFGGNGKVIFITRDMTELLRHVYAALDTCSKLI